MLDDREIRENASRLETKERILGKGMMQPFVNSNSGARKNMYGIQLEHTLSLFQPEVPIVGTGYEIRFGDRSSSIVKAECDYVVVDKISKFSACPNHHYYLILQKVNTGEYDVIERVSYNHTTETYGYLYKNDILDNLDIGYEVPKYEILRTSYSYDDHMNRCDGVNLLTTYITDDWSQEDGIILSESAAKKLMAPLVKTWQIPINDNDVLLNLYGKNGEVKSFPDVGEEIVNNIICTMRREKTEEVFYMQSVERLKERMMSDRKYTIEGEVIDINIYCNNPDRLKDKVINAQLLYYYNDRMQFNDRLVSAIDMLRDKSGNIKMTYALSKLYNRCRQELEGDFFVKDRPDKPYGGTLLEFVVLERSVLYSGDKVTNRYGGKGITAKVVPDEDMLILDDGRRIEAYFNGSTCVNRLNPGQLKEMSLTFAGSRLLQYIDKNNVETDEAIKMIYKFIKFVSAQEAEEFYELMYADDCDALDREWFVQDMIKDGYILLSNKPMSESLTLDTLSDMYKEFPFIQQYDVYSKMKSSTGEYRLIKDKRKITAGQMYFYRLKQYAEEKFMVTSLSSTNLRSENAKSKANKNFETPHANTPIKFGNMEIDEFDHMGTDKVIEMLMIHSVSPHARLLMEEALTGDPYNIDIKLDSESKNIQVEILNARLKVMGLALCFRKIRKEIKPAFIRKAFNKIPILPKAFSYLTDDEIAHMDIDKHLEFIEKMRELSSKRAFITKAFITKKE